MTACSDSDKVIDQITENEERGAVLRQVEVVSGSVEINSATNILVDGGMYSLLLEYQDTEDGTLLSNMDVYVGYDDNTDDNGDNSIAESLFETVPASAFSAGDRGLPQLLYSISSNAMQDHMNLASENIGLGGDAFTVRFVINLTDGRSFSNENNSGTITGSYFNSPFLNSVPVVCAPSMPTAGTWMVETTDSWGDGWNGGSLNIFLDAAEDPTVSIANVDSGQDGPVVIVQNYDFDVPTGTQTIFINYSAGAFDEEVSFKVTSANGNVVVEAGPTPPVGSELLDFCPDNL